MNMRDKVAELERRRAKIREMGGAEKVAEQHAAGKWTCRERLARFYDGGAFTEIGIHGTLPTGPGEPPSPADAIVCGWGQVKGRPVAAVAYDFTVKSGSTGAVGITKISRIIELVQRCRMPMVWFVDSGGVRISEGVRPDGKGDRRTDMVSSFAATGQRLREQAILSGVVPQVAALVGPASTGAAMTPGLADFVPMVKGIGSVALGGPSVVKAATGEDVSEEELGGSKLHCEVTGVGDLEVKDEAACMDAIREYLSFLPQHCEERPPIVATTDPIDRREERLLDLLPESSRQVYDMLELIRLVVDHGHVFELKPRFARSIITGLARLGGYPVGIVANNPRHLGGVLTSDACDKAAHFIQICDAFGLPLVFLADVPGFMAGSKAEQTGIVRHAAKLLHMVGSATVPKLSVVVRKSYGAGYYAMAGRTYEPDLFVAWPGAEITAMGPESIVALSGPQLFGGAEPDAETKAQVTQRLRSIIDIYRVAGWGLLDDVIDPRETRPLLCRAVEMSWNRKVDRPWRRRGIIPV